MTPIRLHDGEEAMLDLTSVIGVSPSQFAGVTRLYFSGGCFMVHGTVQHWADVVEKGRRVDLPATINNRPDNFPKRPKQRS